MRGAPSGFRAIRARGHALQAAKAAAGCSRSALLPGWWLGAALRVSPHLAGHGEGCTARRASRAGLLSPAKNFPRAGGCRCGQAASPMDPVTHQVGGLHANRCCRQCQLAAVGAPCPPTAILPYPPGTHRGLTGTLTSACCCDTDTSCSTCVDGHAADLQVCPRSCPVPPPLPCSRKWTGINWTGRWPNGTRKQRSSSVIEHVSKNSRVWTKNQATIAK